MGTDRQLNNLSDRQVREHIFSELANGVRMREEALVESAYTALGSPPWLTLAVITNHYRAGNLVLLDTGEYRLA